MIAEHKTICILTQSHLCKNPRVLKEAITLAGHGYHIHILNCIYSRPLFKQDLEAIKGYDIRLSPVADLSDKNFRSLRDRALNRAGRLLTRFFGIDNAMALGYGSGRYLRKSLAIKADLYICHQELATFIGTRLIKAGARVAFDFEDWYSEDLLPEARQERPNRLLRDIEAFALASCAFAVTTSAVMAEKLAERYCCKPPAVIYNVFPKQPGSKDKDTIKTFCNSLRLLWFSQTIGPGRGIEEFFHELKAITIPVEIHLLGEVSSEFRDKLYESIPQPHILKFHPSVTPAELPRKIAAFDIGLALEKRQPLSRNYTITNKFFQYIQAGLPVISSPTDGQQEVFSQYEPGFMLTGEPSALNSWLNDPARLQAASARAATAAHYYNWENESKKLLQLIEYTIDRTC